MTNPARDKLLQDNLDWAAAIARKVHKHLPPSFDEGDLVQVAWIELWRRVGLYKGDLRNLAHFRGYAYLAVRGAVYMATRRKHWIDHTHEALEYEEVESGPDERDRAARAEQLAPSIEQEKEEQRARIIDDQQFGFKRHMVMARSKTLRPKDRLMVQRILENVPIEEIAARRGLSVNQVRTRLERIGVELKK